MGCRYLFHRVVAIDPVAIFQPYLGRSLLFTDISLFIGATGMKPTSIRRINRAGNIATEPESVWLQFWIGPWHGGEECSGVRVVWWFVDPFHRAYLDDPAKIHDRDP